MSAGDVPFSTEIRDHVGWLWLDRPERMNAMGLAFWEHFPRVFDTLAEDPAVRVVVIAGRGKAFTAGLDLREMAPLLLSPAADVAARKELLEHIRTMQTAFARLTHCPKPVLAAIHGYCLGGGMDLITACDIRLATEDAVFSVRETRMAIVADLGTLQRLPRLVPEGIAREWIFTGRDISAEEALRYGLVNRCFTGKETLFEGAQTLARTLAANSPLAVQGSKVVLEKSRLLPEAEALEYVALWNTAFLQSEDLKEALQAFMEKRPPQFTGR